jgi:hypothetical protein
MTIRETAKRGTLSRFIQTSARMMKEATGVALITLSKGLKNRLRFYVEESTAAAVPTITPAK